MKIRSKLLGIAGLALLVACGTKEAAAPFTSGPAGRVRFVNLITDPGRLPVNAILESVPFGVNMGYTAATPASLPAPSTAFYAAVLAGDRTIVLLRTAPPNATVAQLTFTIAVDQDRTVYAMGGTAGTAVTSVVTSDDNPLPAATVTRFRVANMSSTAGAVDVFFTATGADLSGLTPNAAGVVVNTTSPYFTLAPGSYQVRFVPAGTAAAARNASVSLTIAAQAYAGGTARTIVAANNASGSGALRGFVLGDR